MDEYRVWFCLNRYDGFLVIYIVLIFRLKNYNHAERKTQMPLSYLIYSDLSSKEFFFFFQMSLLAIVSFSFFFFFFQQPPPP
ncbi:hypothetical protein BY996DRAFT_8107794, partial [Phakopsora pachyrhizi]